MCGGALEIESNASIATCEYCGTKQTLPKLDDEKRANLYDRANHFRRNNEFDKAMGIYEQILSEDGTDAETYWSLVLCRYGIEYVEDPATHQRIPTVNRTQFTSVFDDDNYKSALQYADGSQRYIYEEEAKAINEIQKGILAISQKEEPFDVFICYKESDNTGRRTPDSVLANDLYHQLTQEGFKVFFARITLEDKLGTAYEPYIFAALNSAKVMVVLGTKPEYFNAVWVKNEWARYLSLIKKGEKKMLIPAYKDMDPYDLPEEFSHLQAQDMSKLGFMQDLIRGIKKIALNDEPKQTVIKETVISTADSSTAPLLKRAFMFLEDGDWNSADEYCEKVLDIDPECAEAYVGKLMAELEVNKESELGRYSEEYTDEINYKKALRFANGELKKRLEEYSLNVIYLKAERMDKAAKSCVEIKKVIDEYNRIPDYKDSKAKLEACRERLENARKDEIYSSAIEKAKGNIEIKPYEEAIATLEKIRGWRDSEAKINLFREKIAEIERANAESIRKEEEARIAAEKAKKKAIKIARVTFPVAAVVIVFAIILNTVIIPNVKYNNALELMEQGSYEEAIAAFSTVDGYKESEGKIAECKTAIKDIQYDIQYNKALALIEKENYVEAYDILKSLGDYKDSADKLNTIFPKYKAEKLKNAKVGDRVFFGTYEQDGDTSNGKEDIEWLVLARENNRILVISEKALDCQPYNEDYVDITWENCTLRKWLNGTFVNSAFSEAERAKIPTVTVSADKNPEYSTNPGNATQNKVFLLSITEAEKYFTTDEARKCVPTEYAIDQGAYTSDSYTKNGEATCWWWLRSPGYYQDLAAYVYSGGGVRGRGGSVYYDDRAVRPALWIDLES